MKSAKDFWLVNSYRRIDYLLNYVSPILLFNCFFHTKQSFADKKRIKITLKYSTKVRRCDIATKRPKYDIPTKCLIKS